MTRIDKKPAAAGLAVLIMVAAQTMPASACDTTSLTDYSCGPNSPLNPSSPFYAQPQPSNPFHGTPHGGYGAAPGSGRLGALLGVEPPLPASIVTPGDGYDPGDTRILRLRHHHRRTRRAE